MKTFFLFICFCFTADLDSFINKDIRIFFSSANHVFIGMNKENSEVITKSKYYNLKNFSTVSRIVPDGNDFRLKIGPAFVCVDENQIKKCGKNMIWKINEKPFGYTISQASKCITLSNRATLKMMPCTESKDQILDFKLKSEDQDCGTDQIKNEKQPEEQPEKDHSINITLVGINEPTEYYIDRRRENRVVKRQNHENKHSNHDFIRLLSMN